MEEGTLNTLLARDDIRLLAQLAADCRVDLYLVGGGVRDLLLGRPCQDLDFAMIGESDQLSRRFAAAMGGTFFWLDEERRHERVVLGRGDTKVSYDFVPLQGGGIEADLRLRDFTINGMALPVMSPVHGIVDPMGGMDDLQRGSIRTCSAAAFVDDPVRLVRAFRFVATLGFALANGTWSEISDNASLLQGVAAERVRDEFFKILAIPSSVPILRQMLAAGLLPRIVGPGRSPEWAEESFARMERVEQVVAELYHHFPADYHRIMAQLECQVEDGITSCALLKLAAFFGPVAGREVATLAEGIRLGNRSRHKLQSLCRPELPVGLLLPLKLQTQRSMYRLFRDESQAAVELVLLALADGAISQENSRRLVGYFFNDYGEADDLFLSGADIMALLGAGPGPAIGAAAARLREAESRGVVNSREEALAFLRKNQLTNPAPMG